MKFNVVASVPFVRDLKELSKKYPSIKSDIKNLSEQLEVNPLEGKPLGKNCYKIRMAITSKGKGKSGGGRVITCVKVVANTVILLSIYDKSQKENLHDQELDSLLNMAGL